MEQESVVELCTKFQKMIPHREWNKDSPIRLFGFECGEGWAVLLKVLMDNIQRHIDWENRQSEVVPQVVLEQVKEKFGTLRFYYQGGDEYVHGLVSLAESMSAHICEDCGDTGTTRGGGWVRTLCDKHEQEYQESRKAR